MTGGSGRRGGLGQTLRIPGRPLGTVLALTVARARLRTSVAGDGIPVGVGVVGVRA
jgi:hypothetical protein